MPPRGISCHRNIYSYKADGDKKWHFCSVSQKAWNVSDKSQRPETPRTSEQQQKLGLMSKGSVLGCCSANSPSASLPWNVLMHQFSWQNPPRSCLLLTDVTPGLGWSDEELGEAASLIFSAVLTLCWVQSFCLQRWNTEQHFQGTLRGTQSSYQISFTDTFHCQQEIQSKPQFLNICPTTEPWRTKPQHLIQRQPILPWTN